KGSARMTGAMALGDLSHEIESLVEGIQEQGAVGDQNKMRQVQVGVERMHGMVDHLVRGGVRQQPDGAGSPETAGSEEKAPVSPIVEETGDSEPVSSTDETADTTGPDDEVGVGAQEESADAHEVTVESEEESVEPDEELSETEAEGEGPPVVPEEDEEVVPDEDQAPVSAEEVVLE